MILWIINDYAGSPYHGMEYRHYYLSKEFLNYNIQPYIITASYSHLFFKLPECRENITIQNIDGIMYVWLKVNKYNHSHDFKRIFKWINFASKLYKLIRHIPKPDVIINSPMANFSFLPSRYLAKKLGAKLIFEVKDIWPLTLIELGNLNHSNPLILMMNYIENTAYKYSDAVVSVLPNFDSYLKHKGFNTEKFVYIPNGVTLKEDIDCPSIILDKLISGSDKKNFIIAYTGGLTRGDAIENLLEALYYISERRNNDMKLIIVGNGPEKNKLISIKETLNLKNVIFKDPVPKRCVLNFLETAVDVAYIGWRKRKIYNYGISANKIFDYMLAGVPILHSFSGKGDIVKMANAGITVEAENPRAIAEGILKLYNMSPEERKRLGENGRRYVLEHHTYEKLAEKYISLFRQLLANK